MSETPYTSREIDQKFTSLEDKQDTHFDVLASQLEAILTQTTKTNGRVNSLENWKAYMLGGLAVLTFLVTTLIAVIAIVSQTMKV